MSTEFQYDVFLSHNQAASWGCGRGRSGRGRTGCGCGSMIGNVPRPRERERVAAGRVRVVGHKPTASQGRSRTGLFNSELEIRNSEFHGSACPRRRWGRSG